MTYGYSMTFENCLEIAMNYKKNSNFWSTFEAVYGTLMGQSDCQKLTSLQCIKKYCVFVQFSKWKPAEPYTCTLTPLSIWQKNIPNGSKMDYPFGTHPLFYHLTMNVHKWRQGWNVLHKVRIKNLTARALVL